MADFSEKIFSEYVDQNLHYIPRIQSVSTPEEALDLLKKKHFDLVITMPHIAGMNLVEFGKRVKKIKKDMPVILLTYSPAEILKFQELEKNGLDKIFYWSGDSRIFLAIIKYVEDFKNATLDAKYDVRIILLVEDSHSIIPCSYLCFTLRFFIRHKD